MADVIIAPPNRAVWRQPSLIWAGLGLCATIAALTLTPVLFIIINSFNAASP